MNNELRFCVKCGNEHNTNLENKETGSFIEINMCVKCLMGEHSFKRDDICINIEKLNE